MVTIRKMHRKENFSQLLLHLPPVRTVKTLHLLHMMYFWIPHDSFSTFTFFLMEGLCLLCALQKES